MVLIYLVWILAICGIESVKIRGKDLSFHPSTGRRLGESNKVFFVRSDRPPLGRLAANEAVGPGIYLVRGLTDDDVDYGEWLPEYKYDPKMKTKFEPYYPDFAIQVRTDSPDFSFPGCLSEPFGKYRFRVSCKSNLLKEISEDERVLWISEIFSIRLNSYESRRLMLGGTYTEQSYNASDIRICISDSGVDEYHCAFYEGSTSPRCSVNPSRTKIVGMCNVPGITDFAGTDSSHGTSTSSIAAGLPCLSDTGVAPRAKIYFLDLGPAGQDSSLFVPSDLEARIEASGASVHSASWGLNGYYGQYTDLDSMFDTMARDYPTRCHARSAGNDGPYQKSNSNSKNCFSVGACLSRADAYPWMSSSQRNNHPEFYSHESVISFSSAGNTNDGRVSPQVCAPGYSVRAARGFSFPYSDHADSHLVSGTSFSAPAIAGLIAIIQSKYKATHSGYLPTCALVGAAMFAHAVKPKRVVKATSNTLEVLTNVPPITMFGTPILDFDRWLDIDGKTVQGTNRVSICLVNMETDPAAKWNVVMRWTDVPAVPGADSTIINDLDMVLIGESGEVRVLDDEVNTFEFAENWPAQNTRIVVSVFAGRSTFGAQPFAIHVKGKARVVECLSDVLPYEYSVCPNGIMVTSSWSGATVCKKQVCPSGTCGVDCSRTCAEHVECAIDGGLGEFDLEDTCRPIQCNQAPGMFVGDTECMCRPTTSAKICASGAVHVCSPEGTFAVCTSEQRSEIQVSSANSIRVSIFVVVFMFIIL